MHCTCICIHLINAILLQLVVELQADADSDLGLVFTADEVEQHAIKIGDCYVDAVDLARGRELLVPRRERLCHDAVVELQQNHGGGC